MAIFDEMSVRILVHLSEHRYNREMFDPPFTVTRKGIAEALGPKRSNQMIAHRLDDLTHMGYVEMFWPHRIKQPGGSKYVRNTRRQSAYYLTEIGLKVAQAHREAGAITAKPKGEAHT